MQLYKREEQYELFTKLTKDLLTYENIKLDNINPQDFFRNLTNLFNSLYDNPNTREEDDYKRIYREFFQYYNINLRDDILTLAAKYLIIIGGMMPQKKHKRRYDVVLKQIDQKYKYYHKTGIWLSSGNT